MTALAKAMIGTAPRHIAVIMDGNGRWAKARGLPRTAGHRQGAEAVQRAAQGALDLGVPYLTLYGFSSENWKRPVSEVDDLMGLLRRYLKSDTRKLQEKGARVRIIGDRSRLPADIVELIEKTEWQTQNNDRLTLTIALSYGGRQEIVSAARRLAEAVAAGELDPEIIDESLFTERLFTADMPDPDIILRTSGEQRISNFLLWQSAYSELIFIDKLWPDFTEQDLAAVIEEFQQRDRRYGASASTG